MKIKTEINSLLKNGNTFVTKANTFIDNSEPQVKLTLNNLNTLLKSSDSLIVKFDKLAEETKNKKNNVGKLLYDENIYYKLVDTIDKLNALIKVLNEQLNGDGVNVNAF